MFELLLSFLRRDHAEVLPLPAEEVVEAAAETAVPKEVTLSKRKQGKKKPKPDDSVRSPQAVGACNRFIE